MIRLRWRRRPRSKRRLGLGAHERQIQVFLLVLVIILVFSNLFSFHILFEPPCAGWRADIRCRGWRCWTPRGAFSPPGPRGLWVRPIRSGSA
jgi:hypothetical protein